MCGIAGYIGRGYIHDGRLVETLDSMVRRGPDNQDCRRYKCGEMNVVLMHARLSIIDLDPRSNQPFTFDGCTIVFNGEIYNYIEIKEQLVQRGYGFSTDSDTEVLLKAYHAHGKGCFDLFEGMWACAILDDRTQELVLSRDRFAEKPLYFYQQPDGVYFGSQVKQIKQLIGKNLEIDESQVLRFLVNGHKSLNKTGNQFYKNLAEVRYGSFLVIDRTLNQKEIVYWSPSYNPKEIKEGEAVEMIQSALTRSMELRLRADVPLAFCLSGGVDSSALASIAARTLQREIETFSIIDHDPKYNERDNILSTVSDLDCKHHLIELSPQFDYLDRLRKLISFRGMPVATISYLVHSRLVESMSQRGFKVSISGTGADELFTGYYDHFLLQIPSLSERKRNEQIGFWNEFPAKNVRNPFLGNPNLFIENPDFREHIYLNREKFARYLKFPFDEPFSEKSFTPDLLRNRMLNELLHEVVPVILKEDDANSMYYSIENRSPFLDRGIFDVMSTIPSNLLIQKGFNKYLLRESMKGVLNEKVRMTREKKGFNASISSVIDFNNPVHREVVMSESKVFDWIKRDMIEKLIARKDMTNSYKKFLFNFLSVKLWLDEGS